MEILVAAASLARFSNSPTQVSFRSQKPVRRQLLHCSSNSKNIEENDGSSKNPPPAELHSPKVMKDDLDPLGNGKEENHHDIWQLFTEAQHNIRFLNKQRVLAMLELDRVKNERNTLLDRLKLAHPGRDNFSVNVELLLRIDSLVLNGEIGGTEASDFRSLVKDSRGSLVDDLYDIISKNDAEFLAGLRQFSKRSKMDCFHIIHICTEMSPVVSVTSLASYVTGLSCALQRKGNLVEVILPKYSCLNLDEVQGLREVEAKFYTYFDGQLRGNKVWTGVVRGIGVTFIQPVHYSSFFGQEKVYGCYNDVERFIYFSRAALDYIVKSRKNPDILHIHNWHTSIVGPLFWDVFVKQGLEYTRILLTCQGLDSQCIEHPGKLAICGLDPLKLLRPDRLQDNRQSHLLNLLKGGIVYSNKVVIMSALQTKGQIITTANGLEPTLAIHREKLVIAPFGFDKSSWDPLCDHLIPYSYSSDDMNGKSNCKLALQEYVGFSEGTTTILVGCIYSDILDTDLEKLRTLVLMGSREGVQFILMGSIQSPAMRMPLERILDEKDTLILRDNNVRFVNEYDEGLLHLIIAGSDIMLCPSLDDPRHQVPLKAIKYGTAPIPIVPIHMPNSRLSLDIESTAFSRYIKYTFANMSLEQALIEIRNNPSGWNRRMIQGMKQDFSWDAECADVHSDAYAAIKSL